MNQSSENIPELFAHGLAARNRGAGDEARSYFQAALVAAQAAQDQQGEATALLYLGGLARTLERDPGSARAFLVESLSICRRIAFARGQAYALMELGTTSYQAGNFQEALDWLTQADNEFEALRDRPGQAAVLHQMGLVNKQIGNNAAAERCLNASLSIFQSIDDRRAEGQVLLSLGNLMISHHQDLDQAQRMFASALSCFETAGTQGDEAKARQNLQALKKLIEANRP